MGSVHQGENLFPFETFPDTDWNLLTKLKTIKIIAQLSPLHRLKCPENGLRWSLTAPTGSTGLWWYKVERSEIRTRENWRTIGVGQHLQPKLKYLWYLKCQGCHYISHGIWYYMIFNIWNHMTWHDITSHDITWQPGRVIHYNSN